MPTFSSQARKQMLGDAVAGDFDFVAIHELFEGIRAAVALRAAYGYYKRHFHFVGLADLVAYALAREVD